MVFIQTSFLGDFSWVLGEAFVLVVILFWLQSYIVQYRHTVLIKENIQSLNRAIRAVNYGVLFGVVTVPTFVLYNVLERFFLLDLVPLIFRQFFVGIFTVFGTMVLVFIAAFVVLSHLTKRYTLIAYCVFFIIYIFQGTSLTSAFSHLDIPMIWYNITRILGLLWGLGALWFWKFNGLKDLAKIKTQRESLISEIGTVRREVNRLRRAGRKKDLAEWQRKLEELLATKNRFDDVLTSDKLDQQMTERSRVRRFFKKISDWVIIKQLEDSSTWTDDFMKKFIQVLFIPIGSTIAGLVIQAFVSGQWILLLVFFIGGIALLWQNYRMLSLLNRYPTKSQSRALVELSYALITLFLFGSFVFTGLFIIILLISVYFLGGFWHKLVNLEYRPSGLVYYELEFRYHIRGAWGLLAIFLFLLPMLPPDSVLFLISVPTIAIVAIWKLILASLNVAHRYALVKQMR